MSKDDLFSKKNRNLLSDPLDDNNPITVQVLGICSALAITVQLKPAVVMALSVVAVLSVANVLVSFMRNMIPSRIRIIVFLVVIASLVILVDQVLNDWQILHIGEPFWMGWADSDLSEIMTSAGYPEKCQFAGPRPRTTGPGDWFVHGARKTV